MKFDYKQSIFELKITKKISLVTVFTENKQKDEFHRIVKIRTDKTSVEIVDVEYDFWADYDNDIAEYNNKFMFVNRRTIEIPNNENKKYTIVRHYYEASIKDTILPNLR